MTFKQTILLKHEHGITAQWQSDDYSWMAVATYQQEEKEGTNTDGENVKFKSWVMTNCSGPWTGLSEDKKSLTIIPGYEKEKENVSGTATVILTCLNATVGGEEALKSIWTGPTVGFD
tara:strand:+ start:777 stop:1130 length:354 start_codon:yes stop_codon:yes gene_type:complete